MNPWVVPRYFDQLIPAWHSGQTGRCVHLGYWHSSASAIPDRNADSSLRHSELLAAQHRLDELVLHWGQPQNGQEILDVACGFGGLLQRVGQQFQNVDLTGVNLDESQLKICRSLNARSGNSLRWIRADACQLPFPDQCFDTVFCVEAMFHFASRRQFLQEMLRVLRPGGRFVLTDIRLHTANPTAASDRPFPDTAVHTLLLGGYGPWPDPWCLEGRAQDICGLLPATEIEVVDLTAQTLPTYGLMLPDAMLTSPEPNSAGDPLLQSLQMLHWLHEQQLLRYELITGTCS